ncbi:MAG: tyrosine-type recombinase/integrase [Planctomycetota bacterium]
MTLTFAVNEDDYKSSNNPRATDFSRSGSEQTSRFALEEQKRSQALERILQRLLEKELPGRDQVERYLRDQYRRNCRPNTIKCSFTAIVNFLAFIHKAGKSHLEQISRDDIGAFIEQEQDRGLKPGSVKTRLRALNAFIRFLIENGFVHPDVLAKRMIIKVPNSLPKAMDPDDVWQILAAIDDIRDRAMVLVLLRTGMRIGELLNITLRDLNLKEQRIEIFEAQKNRVGRVVYLSEDAKEALNKWLKMRDPRKEFIFYGQGKERFTYGGARMMFVKYLKKAGLSHCGYTLHCLRHTCASELLNAGMRLECLQQLLGHSSIEMTRHYARLTDKTREEEYYKAMATIERGEINGHYRLDTELQAFLEEKELLPSHSEELHEYP